MKERKKERNLGEQLVDNRVTNTGAIVLGTTLLANGIQLIKDDDVQVAAVPPLLVLVLCLLEEGPDVLLGLAHKFAENLGSVDDLGLLGLEHLADLPGHQGLAGSRGSVEENALDVLDAELAHQLRREDPRGKGAPEDGLELGIKTSNPELLKVEIRGDDGVPKNSCAG